MISAGSPANMYVSLDLYLETVFDFWRKSSIFLWFCKCDFDSTIFCQVSAKMLILRDVYTERVKNNANRFDLYDRRDF